MFSHVKLKSIGPGFFTLPIQGLGAVASFLFTLMVSRQFGAEGVGLIGILILLARVLAILSGLGIPNSIIKFFSIYIDAGRKADAANLFGSSFFISMTVATIFSVLFFCARTLLSDLFLNNSAWIEEIYIILVGILALTAIPIIAATLRGLGWIIFAKIVDGMALSFFAIILMWLGPANDIQDGISSYFGGALIAVLIGSLVLWFAWKKAGVPLPGICRSQIRDGLIVGLPVLGIVLAAFLSELWGFAYISWRLTLQDVGELRVCWQISQILHLFVLAVDGLLGPKVAVLFARQKFEQLGRLLILVTGGLFLGLGAIALFVSIFAQTVLGFFGDEFSAATTLLVILLFSQAAFSGAAILGRTLAVTGYEVASFRHSLWIFLGFVLTLPIFVEFWGSLGAGVGLGLGLIARAASHFLIIQTKTPISLVSPHKSKAISKGS